MRKVLPRSETVSKPGVVRSAGSSRHLGKKFLLLLVSCVFCAAMFVVLDGVYSFSSRKSAYPTREELTGCKVQDAVRVYALRPNCSTIHAWGRDRYRLSVNSLGFRDQTVRQVPLTATKPRILMLGDSFTESKGEWSESYIARLAEKFPQYEFLNGGVDGYSPSTYLTTARRALNTGLDFDEVVVFIDISDVQDEAALVHDIDSSGAVAFPDHYQNHKPTKYYKLRDWVMTHLVLTNYLWEFMERTAVRFGWYHLVRIYNGNIFDLERSAWPYRKVDEKRLFSMGYAPLGVERGIGKEFEKMDELREELAKRNIPISVVVYPWPAQLVHDNVDSRQVRIWRQWCEGRCKRFVTVFPAFFDAQAKCPSWEPGCWYVNNYILGDIHFNAAGNAMVAAAVSKSLEAVPPMKHVPAVGPRATPLTP
jgi:hypothetical protein